MGGHDPDSTAFGLVHSGKRIPKKGLRFRGPCGGLPEPPYNPNLNLGALKHEIRS